MTTTGAIDRATAYMIPAIMTFGNASKAFRWAQEPALTFTLSGLFFTHVTLSADPTVVGPAAGVWGTFLSSLGGLVQSEHFPAGKLRTTALQATHKLGADSRRLAQAIQALKEDPSYDEWLAWHAQYEWLEHTRRLGGFFDHEFSQEISGALGVEADETSRRWIRLSDRQAVEQLGNRVRAGHVEGEDVGAIDSWLVSTLLRGVYHDELARLRRRQHVRHPVRAFLGQDAEPNAHTILLYASPAQRYFAGIILGLSYSAKEPAARCALYGENLIRCRSAIATDQLLLPDAGIDVTANIGLDRAVHEAQHLLKTGVLKADRRRFALAVDISIGVATAVTGFALSPWVGLAAGAAASVGRTIVEPGRRIASQHAASVRHLRDLAESVAGSVQAIR
jgi:hypothetical protein